MKQAKKLSLADKPDTQEAPSQQCNDVAALYRALKEKAVADQRIAMEPRTIRFGPNKKILSLLDNANTEV